MSDRTPCLTAHVSWLGFVRKYRRATASPASTSASVAGRPRVHHLALSGSSPKCQNLYAIETFGLNILKWEAFHSFCSFLIYFALGAKAADTSLFTDLRTLSWIRLSGPAVIGYVLIAAAVATNLSNLPLLHAVLAIAGMIATIALAILISNSRGSSFVRILGVYSLEIYVVHTIFAGGARIAMQKGLGYSGPLLHVVVGTTIGICIPLLLAIWAPILGLPYLFTGADHGGVRKLRQSKPRQSEGPLRRPSPGHAPPHEACEKGPPPDRRPGPNHRGQERLGMSRRTWYRRGSERRKGRS
jgi:hypothetical protein